MEQIKLSREQVEYLAQKLQSYLGDELDIELGQFDAEFLLEFIGKEVGKYYYAQGIEDARSVLSEKIEQVEYGLDEIKPVL